MHSALAGQEVGCLKRQLNLRQEKSEGRKGKQFISAAEFLMALEASKAEKAEKKRVKAEKAAAKVLAEKENKERWGHLVHNTKV